VALTQAHDGYVPLGAPVRWSLAARRLTGFMPSPRARHPLNHLFRATN
jgi:peptide/nickel transport system substrate-binding protein